MNKKDIAEAIKALEQTQQIKTLLNNPLPKIHLKGVVGSSLSFLVSLFNKSRTGIVFILENKEQAAYYLNDLESIMQKHYVSFFPETYKHQLQEVDNTNALLRTQALRNILTTGCVLVTYPDAIAEKVMPAKQMQKAVLSIFKNQNISMDSLNEKLFDIGFSRTDFVSQPGEFSVRGGILDVFSFSNEDPYRIEFFGDEIESIRTFDIETQCSDGFCDTFTIVPNVNQNTSSQERVSLLEYIPKETLVVVKNASLLTYALDVFFKKAESVYQNISKKLDYPLTENLFCSGEEILKKLETFSVIDAASDTVWSDAHTISYHQQAQPSFNKNFGRVSKHFRDNHRDGIINYIACDNAQQSQRFVDIFDSEETEVPYKTLPFTLHQGFYEPDAKIACYTDHQLFSQYHKFRLNNIYDKSQAIAFEALNQLEIGDYVTHIDHGVGIFGGLKKIQVEGRMQEAIKLVYDDNDILYVSVHSLHKISKFNGKDGTKPKIHKLGSKVWNQLKNKTKKHVKEMAFSLIDLYAKRKSSEGIQYKPDTFLQHELEASFIHQDTSDQVKATQDIKSDMESPYPMDRLICGDVGFGKTEMALRAAFKAVDNGKQVAVLVPTTILAFQHYDTFSKRLEPFSVVVDYLNRFRTAKDRNRIVLDLSQGKIDIVIGTHALIGDKIKFKDLGLLIVDEEQKFGVGTKDKLKTLRANTDVLTLTATPIPRTLQFSLMSARDLSVITTPPPNRVPIESSVVTFNKNTISEAINYELARNGQVFFIHNRVNNIKEIAEMIRRLSPGAKVGIGHGQMNGKELETIMMRFIKGHYDVLVATSIIENGLDIPNANTILINNAHNFGLSDLHQMRGRVGRSDKKAFCYFMTPPLGSLSEESRKRMQTIEQFTALGSGFHIAMKDLEIRGAGDLLGGEQSGFINTMGFDTYQKILQEAVEELKNESFSDIDTPKSIFVKEVQLDTDLELLFPDDYINTVSERLKLYKALNEINELDELSAFENTIKDRFGKLPPQSVDLLNTMKIKWKAKAMGLDNIILKNSKMIAYFIADKDNDFYKSDCFSKILQQVQKNTSLCSLKEKQTRNGLRLMLTFEDVKTITSALQKLSIIEPHKS